ncbi:MAG: AraC family transcriptional regulator [Pseudomonadota bacterium]
MNTDAPGAITITPLPQIAARAAWRAETLHASDAHTLLWFTKGQGRIVVEGKRSTFAINTVVFLPAGTPHAFDARPGHFGQVLTAAPHPTLEMPEAPILYRVRDVIQHGEFVSLFEALQRELTRNGAPVQDTPVTPIPELRMRAARLHVGLIGVWLSRQTNQLRTAQANASEALARRFTQLVERDYAKGRSVDALARELGVTPTHLTRACKSALGLSAHTLLNERVMHEARAMLTQTSRPVGQIAQGLGFSSAAYFTRAFQKQTGRTPSAFRTTRTPLPAHMAP